MSFIQDQPNIIDFNGFKMIKNDETESISISDRGLRLDYGIGSANPTSFRINPNGMVFEDNAGTKTTGLERIALVQTALASVELPPNATTLKLNDTLLLDNGSTSTNTINEDGLVITNAGGSSTHSFQLLNLLQTGVGSCILNPDTITCIRNGAGGALNPQLNLRNDNATGSVAMEVFKNKPTAGVNGEPLFTQSVFGKDSLNNKQEYTRITHTIRDITSGSEEGSIEMGCFIGGAYANMLQLNGVDTPAGEINVLRPIDLSTGSTGLIKISGSGSTDMSLDATLSAGTGNINISPKLPTGVVNVNGDIFMDNSELLQIRDTANQNRIEIEENMIDMFSTNGGDGSVIQIVNDSPADNNLIIQRYTEDIVAGDIGIVSSCRKTAQFLDMNDTRPLNNKFVKLDNSGTTENRLQMRKNQGGGVYQETNLVNATTDQTLYLTHTNNAVYKQLSFQNLVSGGATIGYGNLVDSSPLLIDSNNTPLKLQTTGTTASSGDIEFAPSQSANGQIIFTGASLEDTTSTGSAGKYLKIVLNGVSYKIALDNN